jgi:hypothetical protein
MSVLGLVLLAGQVALAPAPYNVPAVPDPVLAAERGGFTLPGGIDVALTVQTQTAIDGAVVLRTVFEARQGTPTTSVFVPAAGTTVTAAARAAGAAAGAAVPVITFDRRNGLQVVTAGTGPAVSIMSETGPDPVPAGLEKVTIGEGGLVTDRGTVSRSSVGDVERIAIDSAGLRVSHLTGAAFGSTIENATSGRTIDVTTSVGIDLRGAGPDTLGSSMFRVQNIALDALSARGN